jgi:hypothetical protein
MAVVISASTIIQSNANLIRLSVLVGIIDRFLGDAQQFFLDLRRTRARLAGDSDLAARNGKDHYLAMRKRAVTTLRNILEPYLQAFFASFALGALDSTFSSGIVGSRRELSHRELPDGKLPAPAIIVSFGVAAHWSP